MSSVQSNSLQSSASPSTKVLSAEQVALYRQNGIHFPVDVLTSDMAAELLAKLQSIESANGGRLSGRLTQKPYLLFPWINQLIYHPAILDAVEDVLGPNLLCWSAQFFIKNARDPSFVSWHQDATYWGLSSPDVMTAWVALTPSTVPSGCMRVIPATHHEQVSHADTFSDGNLLSRGQEIAVNVDLDKAVDVVLQPGQMSLHHVLLFHGSEPNTTDHRRIGFAIRYIPTHVRQLSPIRDSATLVRGVDTFNYFDHEPIPAADLHPDAVAKHKEVVDRQLKILYTGAKQAGRLGSTVGL